MKILLRYRDNLPAKAEPADKMRLRFFLSRQLKRVWDQHFESKHPVDKLPIDKARKTPKPESLPYFVALIGNHRFIPLVTHANRIQCRLAIRYGRWREGDLAQILDNGDLDARIKALLDGLAIPNAGNPLDMTKVLPEHQGNTCYVLAEDDRLIERIEIETFEILDTPPGRAQDNLETVFHVMVSLKPSVDVVT